MSTAILSATASPYIQVSLCAQCVTQSGEASCLIKIRALLSQGWLPASGVGGLTTCALCQGVSLIMEDSGGPPASTPRYSKPSRKIS